MPTLVELSQSDSIDPSWAALLQGLRAELAALDAALGARSRAGAVILPERNDIFAAFRYPQAEVKVLILGQDPYPTRGHGLGRAFAVSPSVSPMPKSLINIDKELAADLGVSSRGPRGGFDQSLSEWSAQGVMLLNRVLTVDEGHAGSHRNLGWEKITEAVIRALVARKRPLVAVLWGNQAQSASTFLTGTPVIASAHPSPLSAYRGFFGSRPFSRVNAELVAQGATPIDWLR